MKKLANYGFITCLSVALLGWTIAWVCGHSILLHHDHHNKTSAGDHHQHGPFEHSHNSAPSQTDHEVPKIGLALYVVTKDSGDNQLFRCVAQPVFDISKGVSVSKFFSTEIVAQARAGPLIGHSSGRYLLLQTDRWLI
ncbi:MAG: hypothetical protein GY847_24235 [Proteobacteria bacterium]|nr:hypothetical protein [Pseudomonadota bacterium]